jgi:hypothetical protein
MIRIDEKRIEELLGRWPRIRRNLSEVVSSRRLEEIDELIDDLYDVITPDSEENGA